MAASTCGKCGGNRFENVEQTPNKSNFRYVFIQCAGCGVVVGVVDAVNVPTMLYELAQALKIKLS
jgi:hypothetical protein